jgi:glycosyltransferase involved in cell wall biosynthesis
MTNAAKITAILPCFNHARFLEERIDSVLSQTHPVDQIVFLDDASTDGSVDLAEKLLKEFPGQVDFYVNPSNSGSPFAQWNKGVSFAKHELIWIAETDDSCDPSLIKTLYSSILRGKTVLSYAQSRFIGDEGQDLGSALSYTDRLWPSAFQHSFSMDGAQFNWRYMVGLNAIPNASAVLFRKDAYLSAGGANDAMSFCGDWDAWIRMCSKGRVEFISDELNYFRCHASTSRAAGYTAKAAAEYFACRLSAYLVDNQARSSSLSAIDVMKSFLDPSGQWQWNQVVRSLSLNSLPEAKCRCQELCCSPALRDGAWIMLQGLYSVQEAIGQLAALPRRLRRLLLKGFRFVFGHAR